MYYILNILYVIYAAFYLPVLILKGKWHALFSMRMGFFSESQWKHLAGQTPVWVHAVSVGEVLAVVECIKRLQEQRSGLSIVCSVVTKTGYALAQQQLPKSVQVIYAPLDFSWAVKKYIRLINPQLYISAETEWWPNIHHFLSKQKVPIIHINGRLSDPSFMMYQRYKWFFRRIIETVSIFAMQTQQDAQKVIRLGADPQHVKVIGNMKFDMLVSQHSLRREDLGFNSDDLVFIAGSTHPGEEEILITIYKELKSNFPTLKLILAPRHVERSQSLLKDAEKYQCSAVYLSDVEKMPQGSDIYIVDTIGQLRALYQLADIVFIGKTLKVGGGQNMIEPASVAKPVIVGPLTGNFKGVMEVFLQDNAIIEVNDENELRVSLKKLLLDSEYRNEIGAKAKHIVEQQRGSLDKTLAVINPFIQ